MNGTESKLGSVSVVIRFSMPSISYGRIAADLRQLALLERKRKLNRLFTGHSKVLYAQRVEARGCELFEVVRQRDLEGIVAKRKDAAYGVEWFKIRNPSYTQYEGRRELFERNRRTMAS